MSNCLRNEIRELWGMMHKNFEHLVFAVNNNDILIADCNRCGAMIDYFSLANATNVNEALKEKIASHKREFVVKHEQCKKQHKQQDVQAFERRIRELAAQVADTVIRKHKDYGRSGLQAPVLAPHIPPLDALLVRQSDKYSRLQNLLKKGTPEVKESILDTALDILGYDMLLAVEIEGLMNV